MLAITYGAALLGVDAQLITIEVNISKGVNTFMVGLPDAAVKESLHRIDASFKNTGYKFPLKGITINLAPANVKKEGSAFDLPIAIGVLAASGQINGDDLASHFFMGELALDGSLRPLKGILPMAILAREKGYKRFILPTENAQEAAIVDGLEVFACKNIQEAITVLDRKSVV